ncbi:MAG: hypothetical protein H0T89_22380 [Deltaproteobacteria bacterium]|nr:hypothetical protein [Deltaproteobacteria bacterium]MDQ3295189.1 hypothetical protein [Myxococcota bacterium]
MIRRIVCAVLITAGATGCLLDRHRKDRPARFVVGTHARGLATGTATAAPASDVAARTTTEPASASHGAKTLTGQFTMVTQHLLYGGVEVEAGVLEERGSNFGGAYGVVGAEQVSRAGAIGVELVGGWRGLRERLGATDVNTYVAEPRVRAQLRLGPQLMLGAVAGATVGERGSWMAGLTLGFHSHAFGR